MTGEELGYTLWFHGPESEKEDTNMETDTGSDGVSSLEHAFDHLPFFTGDYVSDSPCYVYGKLIGEDEIRWVDFSNGAHMYWGKVNLEDGSIEGEWGRTPTEMRSGTFKITKREIFSDDEDQDLDGTESQD